MNYRGTKYVVLAGLFLALGLLLPFLTLQVPTIGKMLLPMHIPVLLAGFVLGGPLGLLIGFATPLLRSFLFGMPPFFPGAVAMSLELAAYGLSAGLLYRALPKNAWGLYTSLIASMLLGRVVWGVATLLFFGVAGNTFTWPMFLAGAFLDAYPGIILQLILIPATLVAFRRAGLTADAR